MPKIGRYDYPSIGFKTMLDAIEAISTNKVTTISGAADVCGHKSPKSGAFLTKMAGLSKYYKLALRRGDNIELTKLAKRILYADTPEEKKEAITESIMGVSFFHDMHERLGKDYDKDTFATHLREQTGAERDVAVEQASYLRNLYDGVMRYVSEKKPAKDERKDEKEKGNGEGVDMTTTDGWVKVVSGDDVVSVPLTEPFVKAMKDHLDDLLKKSTEKESEADTEESPQSESPDEED